MLGQRIYEQDNLKVKSDFYRNVMAEPTQGDGTCWNTLRIKTLLFSHQDSFIAVLKRR